MIGWKEGSQSKVLDGYFNKGGFKMNAKLNTTMVYLSENDRHEGGVVFLQDIIDKARGGYDKLSEDDRAYFDAAVFVVSQRCDHAGKLFKN